MAFHVPEGVQHQGLSALPENGTSLYPHLAALLNNNNRQGVERALQDSTSKAFPVPQKEHVSSSSFHDLLDSSRTSARLHGSMLGVDMVGLSVDLALPRAAPPLLSSSSGDLVFLSSSLKHSLHNQEEHYFSPPVLSSRNKSRSVICVCQSSGDAGGGCHRRRCSANHSQHSPTTTLHPHSTEMSVLPRQADKTTTKPHSFPGRSAPKPSLYLRAEDIKNTDVLKGPEAREAGENPFKSFSVCPSVGKHLTKTNLCQANNSAYEPRPAPHLLRHRTHNATGRNDKEGCPRGLGRQIPVSTWRPKGACYLSNESHTSSGQAIHTLKGSGSSGGVSLERRQKSGRKGTFHHQTPPIPPHAATAPGGHGPEHTAEQRYLSLHTFHLQRCCFRTWLVRCRAYSQARLHYRKRLLTTGLNALKGAVLSQQAHTQVVHRRVEAWTLAHAFHQWKIRTDARKREPGCDDEELDGLRRRLTQPSNTLALRMTQHTVCIWQRRSPGLTLHRAALIHYHLNILWKYWLLWKKTGCRHRALSNQEEEQRERAALHWKNRLMRQTYTVWTGAALSQRQRRDHLLVTTWRRWQDRALQRREAWSVLTNRSQCYYRRRRLRCSFLQWRVKAEDQTTQRNALLHSCRRFLQLWHVGAHRSRLQRLCTEAQGTFTSRRLAVAFGEWRLRKAAVDAVRADTVRGRHLLDRRRMASVFRVWLSRARARRGATELLGRRRKSLLVIVIQRWYSIVERERACAHYRHRSGALAAARVLSVWRSATALRSLHTRLLTHLLHDRRTPQTPASTTHTPGLGQSELTIHPLVHCATLEEVTNYLQLQRSFHIWRKKLQMFQRARLHAISRSRKLAQSALQQWHRVAQDAQAHRVLRFQAKLAAGGCASSSSSSFNNHTSSIATQQEGSRGCVLRRVFVCMLQPSLSRTFSQWRDYVQARKEKRSFTSKATAQLACSRRRAIESLRLS